MFKSGYRTRRATDAGKFVRTETAEEKEPGRSSTAHNFSMEVAKETKRKANETLMVDENDEKISINFGLYWRFYSKYYGFWFMVCSQLSLILFTAAKILNDYLVGSWASSADQHSRFWYYCIASVIFILAMTLGVYGRVGSCQLFTWRAAKILHAEMIDKIVLAPVNLYFDITPVGRVLNKFSKDLNAIETQQGWLIGMILSMVYLLMQVFAVAIYAVPWIAVVVPVVAMISYVLVRAVTNALRETVRLTNTTKSPLLSYLGETINGASTIRAFGMNQRFIKGNNKLLNDNILANQMMAGVAGWFAIKVDLIALLIMSVVSFVCVLCRGFTDPIVLSMLLSYVLTI